jgi:small subunit ribosomal protein S7
LAEESVVQHEEADAVAPQPEEKNADLATPSAAAAVPQPAAKAKKTASRRATKKENIAFTEPLLFGKYNLKEVVVGDPSLANYITLAPKTFPNTFGRRKKRAYYVAHVNIVERLINKLMRGGTGQKIGGKVIRTEGALQGKKMKVMHIVENAFESINKKTGKNPVQVLVDALENSAPIEDTTRIRYGGINYNVAVGISASRRLDVALRNVALSSLIGAFKSKKTLAEALADELILAANKDPNSYAIKKKVELERIARSAR